MSVKEARAQSALIDEEHVGVTCVAKSLKVYREAGTKILVEVLGEWHDEDRPWRTVVLRAVRTLRRSPCGPIPDGRVFALGGSTESRNASYVGWHLLDPEPEDLEVLNGSEEERRANEQS